MVTACVVCLIVGILLGGTAVWYSTPHNLPLTKEEKAEQDKFSEHMEGMPYLN
jgi:hypothetical protein